MFGSVFIVSVFGNLSSIVSNIYIWFWLKHETAWIDNMMIYFAFGGVLIFCYSKYESKSDSIYPLWYLGVTFAILSALCGGIWANVLREMNKEIHFLYSPFWSAFSGVVVLPIYFLPNMIHISSYDLADCIYLIINSTFSIFGQIFYSLAYKYGETNKVLPVMYSMMIFTFLFDCFYLRLDYSIFQIFGCFIIFISLLIPPLSNLIKTFN